jgi:hypothetical protein
MGTITFTYDRLDNEYLEVVAERGSFRGRGVAHAMFLDTALREFLAAADGFPLSQASFELRGPGLIACVVRPINSTGHLEIKIELAELFGDSSAIIRSAIDYEELKDLRRKTQKLTIGSISDFVFRLSGD